MASLPDQPDLEQLRRQAKDLLRAIRRGNPAATERLTAVGAPATLAGAQLVLAREHGHASWPTLKAEVERRTKDWTETVAAFVAASVGGRLGRAARILADHPGVADRSLAAALVLGDAAGVRLALAADPAAATRIDPSTGWSPLHAACSSRWHVDPGRAAGLLDIVTELLAAGADVNNLAHGRQRWTPLRCAITSATAGTGNLAILRFLLDRGAAVTDHDLYLAAFATEPASCVGLLLEQTPDVEAIAEQALAASISTDDVEVTRLLLQAGADPNRYRDDNGTPTPVVAAALVAGASTEILGLLLRHSADPEAAAPDGRSPVRIATAAGRRDVVAELLAHGARDTATPADRLLDACHHTDRAAAEQLLSEHPSVLNDPATLGGAALPKAAEAGNDDAVALMFDLGFPANARSATDDGATALHLAAYNGRPPTVELLIRRGADLEARDTTWNSTALTWAVIGSGERPTPNGDWPGTVALLLDAGASTADITLNADDPKPPSDEVALLIRGRIDARES